jgi:hypothetical protein
LIGERRGRHNTQCSRIHIGAFAQAVKAISNLDFLDNLTHIPHPILFRQRRSGSRDGGLGGQMAARTRAAQAYRFEICGHGVSLRRSAEFALLVNRFAAKACI